MAELCNIFFQPANIKGRIQKGETIFTAARMHDIVLRSDCGEKGTCGECRIIVDHPGNLTPRTGTEKKSFPHPN